MSVRPTLSSNSMGQNLNEVNALARIVQNEQEVKVVKDSTGTRVVILDKDGLRTTEPGAGIDVVSATNDQFTFNSANNTFKIVQTATATMASPGAVDPGSGLWGSNFLRTTIAHGLGFAPVIIAYVNNGGQFYPMMWQTMSGNGSEAAFTNFVASVDATNVYLDCTIATFSATVASATYDVKYYLLQETAN